MYRVRLGDYRLFYSFGSGWVKLLSIRKRDDRTYELERNCSVQENSLIENVVTGDR